MLWAAAAERPALEPRFLQRVWYWDDFYDAVIGRPGQALARLQRHRGRRPDHRRGGQRRGRAGRKATGNGVRRLQTGYVRNYALGIALGLAAIIVFMVSRVWWS